MIRIQYIIEGGRTQICLFLAAQMTHCLFNEWIEIVDTPYKCIYAGFFLEPFWQSALDCLCISSAVSWEAGGTR